MSANTIAPANAIVNIRAPDSSDKHSCRRYDSRVRVGARIEMIRDRLGISFAELGRRAGIPGQTITAIVRTSREREDFAPDTTTLRKIAAAAHVSEPWLIMGHGSLDDGAETTSDRPADQISDSEAPRLMNLPGWEDLVATAQALDEARGVPQWAFDLLGWSNGLVTVPLVPSSIVELAKLVMKYTSPADAEAALSKLRSATNRR